MLYHLALMIFPFRSGVWETTAGGDLSWKAIWSLGEGSNSKAKKQLMSKGSVRVSRI